mgnify:CR=1 FL=1
MADRKYTIGRPTQEVRLRNWKGGQAAQFKKAMDFLESELNSAMAAQVAQGAKRVISNSIPAVTGLSVTAGFKSFQITFNEARGISNILFYEIEKSGTANFASSTTYTTPQTTLTIPTNTEREQIYVRVRVLNSKFQAGPWSSTDSATGSSNFRISTTRGARTTLEIAPADFDTWVDVMSVTVQPTVSAISVSIQPGLLTRMTYETSPAPPTRTRITYHTMKYRLLKNGVEYTDIGTIQLLSSASYFNNSGESETTEVGSEKAVFGVLVSPLETFANGETVTYTIQAFVVYNDPDYGILTYTIDESSNILTVIDNPVAVIDNFDVMEVIQVT